MSHVSTTATTTTPLVTVVSSGLSSVSSVTVAPSLTGFPVSLDQCGVVQPPPLMPRGSGGVIGSVSVPQQQTPPLMPLLAYANYAMGSPWVGFFSFGVYPWQAYVQPIDGHWSMLGMHRVVAPSATLGRGSLLLLS